MYKLGVRMGTITNTQGVLFVIYFGTIIAVLDAEGVIVARNYSFPMYLIEYLIKLPTPEQARRN